VARVEQLHRARRGALAAEVVPAAAVAEEDPDQRTTRLAVRLGLVVLVLVLGEPGGQPSGELAVTHERAVEQRRGVPGEPRQRCAHVVRVHDAEQLQALGQVQVRQQLADAPGELVLVRSALRDSG
jgi:hypothetical protein